MLLWNGGIALICVLLFMRFKKDVIYQDAAEEHDEATHTPDTQPAERDGWEDASAEDFLVYHTQFARRFHEALEAPNVHSEQVQAGDHGEARVLQAICYTGGGIVYWGLGLSNRNSKCEMGILVVAPHGLLHVNVKNLRGTWESGEFYAEPKGRTVQTWRRQEDGLVLSKSPVFQANRARKMLGSAVSDLCNTMLPVHSVVVVANDSFQFSGDTDDGVTIMSLDEFDDFYRDFAHGSLARLQAARKGTIGSLVQYISGYGQRPAFYDLRMFSDHPDEKPEVPLMPGAFEDNLLHHLNEVWGLDYRIPKHDQIWFGDKDDMDPNKNNSKSGI